MFQPQKKHTENRERERLAGSSEPSTTVTRLEKSNPLSGKTVVRTNPDERLSGRGGNRDNQCAVYDDTNSSSSVLESSPRPRSESSDGLQDNKIGVESLSNELEALLAEALALLISGNARTSSRSQGKGLSATSFTHLVSGIPFGVKFDVKLSMGEGVLVQDFPEPQTLGHDKSLGLAQILCRDCGQLLGEISLKVQSVSSPGQSSDKSKLLKGFFLL